MGPPAALIPLEKYDRIREETQVIKEDKYASHQENSELFPQSSKNTRLPEQTKKEINNLLDKRYGQTTYSESYYDQKKGTTLSLGPQFQFYPSDDENEEVQEKSEQTIEKEETQNDEETENEAAGNDENQEKEEIENAEDHEVNENSETEED